MLWRALGNIENGVYVDIGAHHPVIDSISKAFYDHGWRGVNIEPGSSQAALLRAERPRDITIEAMVAERPGIFRFYETPGGGLSTGRKDIAEEHRKNLDCAITETFVTAITLDDALSIAPGEDIHWLKIDAEGFERNVLLSWRTSPRRPWILVIEATHPKTNFATHHEWEDLVLRKDYKLVYQDGLNRYYLDERHGELASHFELPPNVFDDFQLEEGISSLFTRSIRERFSREWINESARIVELESQLATAREERQSTERVAAAEKIFLQRLAEYQRELADTEDRIRERHLGQIDALQAEARSYLERLIGRERELGSELQMISCQLTETKNEIQRREEAVRHELTLAIGELTKSLETARAENQSNVERLVVQLAERLPQIDVLAGRIAETKYQVANLTSQIDERQGEIGEIFRQLSESQSRVNVLTHQSEEIRSEVGGLTQREFEDRFEVRGLTQQVAEGRSQVAHLTKQVADGQSQAGSLVQQVAENQSKVGELTERVAETRFQLQDFARQVADDRLHLKRLLEVNKRSLVRRLPWPLRLWGQQNNSLETALRAFSGSVAAPFGTLAADDLESKEKIMTLQELLALPNEDFLRSVFVFILGREPDESGLNNYRRQLGRGVSKKAIVAEIAESKEARARYSHLDLAQLSDNDFVDAIYSRVLGRSPDPEGKRHHLDRLRKNADRRRIIVSLGNSEEALRRDPAGASFRRDLNMLLRRERRRPRWLNWGQREGVHQVAAMRNDFSNGIVKISEPPAGQNSALGATIEALSKAQREEMASMREQIGALRAAVDELSKLQGAALADGAALSLKEISETATATRDYVRLLIAAVEGMANAKGLTTAKR